MKFGEYLVNVDIDEVLGAQQAVLWFSNPSKVAEQCTFISIAVLVTEKGTL